MPHPTGPAADRARPSTSQRLDAYLTEQDRLRAMTVERVLAKLDPRERALHREAAVMGYVHGTMAGDRAPFPKDSQIVAAVITSCVATDDLYPNTAALAGHITPWRPHEQVAARIVDLHRPLCTACGEHPSCACDAPARCGTCAADAGSATWPCPTVLALGRVAACENIIDEPDLTGHPCPGVLIFRPDDPQARCLACGAWCGSLAATYLSPA